MRERALSLGGSVSFRSEAGKGTAVAVTIPIHAPKAEAKAKPALHVLIIDDHAAMRRGRKRCSRTRWRVCR
jgi:hypothetical protein